MIFHKYFNFLFLFLFSLLSITTARIPISSNSKREAPLSNAITEEVIETHSKSIVPNAGLPIQQPPVLLAPSPFALDQWKHCNLWCRLRVFLNERDIITKEYLNRQIAIKNTYGSQKIPGLFFYNSLLKRQKDIASRTNEFQKATELTAHLFSPLFRLLQFTLPQFGPNLSPVLTGHLLPLPLGGLPPPGPKGPLGEPVAIPKGPLGEPVVIPKGSPFPLPQPILTPRGPQGEPVIIPKGSPFPLPQPILSPKGPAPPPVLIPKGPPLPPPVAPLPARGPGIIPFQASGYFSNIVPTPQALIDNRAQSAIATRVEKNSTPIPAPSLPSLSPSALPIPPQPGLFVHPPPPFVTHEISEVAFVSPTPLARGFSSSPTPVPTKLSRGESGIVVTTVLPPSSFSSATNTPPSPSTSSTTTALPTSKIPSTTTALPTSKIPSTTTAPPTTTTNSPK